MERYVILYLMFRLRYSTLSCLEKFASGVVVCKVSKRLYSNITSPENNPFREAGGCSVNAM